MEKIKIGNYSFTQVKRNDFNNDWNGSISKCRNDSSKSFHMLKCESMECIQIGEYSFSDYGGNFELKNLPQLQFIQIGTIGSY